MKTSRTTFVLIGLFFAGLLILWGLEFSGVLTEAERNRRIDRVLPSLIDVKQAGVRKVEIERDGERLIFERRGERGWQMREPLDVAADPGDLENLIVNLKALRRSADSGTIQGPAESYGLTPPAATVRLWGDTPDSGPTRGSSEFPLAVLELGKTNQGTRFVRTGAGAGIEVVEDKVVAAIDRPAAQWRDTLFAPVPTFKVSGIAIHRPGLDLRAQRGPGGQWRLTSPARLPADGAKIENALAALSSIRINERTGGFVADGVKDFAPFGLDEPAATIELTSTGDSSEPLILMIGKSPADHPDQVYVRRGDQDDVALVESRFLSEIPTDRTGFRGQHIAAITPSAVDRIEIQGPGGPFEIVRNPGGWELKAPRPGKADRFLVESLLGEVDALQTSEFLDPERVPDAGLAPPLMTLKVWQGEADRADRAGSEPDVDLKIGRHDVLKKTVYAQIPGDTIVLALPDKFLSVLPKTSYAYGDRALPAVPPESVVKLTVALEGRAVALEPDQSSKTANQWRMTSPVKAPADVQAVTAALAALLNMRAIDYVAENVDDGARFGFDKPILEVTWECVDPKSTASGNTKSDSPGARTTTSLRVGKAVVGQDGMHYATLSGRPAVFTVDAMSLQPFVAEFHDPLVLSFSTDAVRRLVLRSPHRTLAFTRRAQPLGNPSDWSPEPGTSTQGVDLSRFHDLIKGLSQLRTPRFMQYEGPITESTGLAAPRLVVEVDLGDGGPPRRVRFGASTNGGLICAAVGDETSGPVFLMPAAAWEAVIQWTEQALPPLPADVFAPN